MTTEEIVQYVLTSPQNTNPNMLRQMIDEISEEPAPLGDLYPIVITVTFTNPGKITVIGYDEDGELHEGEITENGEYPVFGTALSYQQAFGGIELTAKSGDAMLVTSESYAEAFSTFGRILVFPAADIEDFARVNITYSGGK